MVRLEPRYELIFRFFPKINDIKAFGLFNFEKYYNPKVLRYFKSAMCF